MLYRVYAGLGDRDVVLCAYEKTIVFPHDSSQREDGSTPILTKSAGVVGGLSCERFILQNDHRCMRSEVRHPLLRYHVL